MKIHRNIFSLIAAVFLIMGMTPIFGQMKIRYVNTERIFSEYPGAQEVQKEIDDLRGTYEAEFQKQENELKALVQEIQNQSLLLSPEKKAQKETEAQQKQVALERYYYEKLGPQGEVYKKYADLTKPLQEKILRIINKIGEDEGYDYILDTVQGIVLFAKADHDITDKVLEELNKSQ